MFNRRELLGRSLCFGLLPFLSFNKTEDVGTIITPSRLKKFVERVCPKIFLEKLGKNTGFRYHPKYTKKVATVLYEYGYIEKIGDVIFCRMNYAVNLKSVYGPAWELINANSFIYYKNRGRVGNHAESILCGMDGYIWSKEGLDIYIKAEKERLNV